MDFKVGDIIKTIVIGSQHYGIFVRSCDDESYSGLIHISEISDDFIKDINKVAKLNDYVYAKILDVDKVNKHLKLSIRACSPKTRYRSSYAKKIQTESIYSDFSSLDNHLNDWIQEQLKEKRNAKN